MSKKGIDNEQIFRASTGDDLIASAQEAGNRNLWL